MKLKFLGVGGAFASRNLYQSNAVIEFDDGLMLIDCGTDIRFSLQKAYPHINNGNVAEYVKWVYCSHLHADHCGGLEWLGFCSYFQKQKPQLYCREMDELWHCTLRGTMEKFHDCHKTLADFFQCNRDIMFNVNNLEFTTVVSPHISVPRMIKYSYGLAIKGPYKKTYFSTDVMQQNWELNQIEYHVADQIFHDCETYDNKSNVHYHYEDLTTLPDDIKAKMWLYHYSEDALDKYNPIEDGFRGFVKKGDEFEI